MSSGIRALLDISSRALSVQTRALQVIGNNISNVNTEGYTRRRINLNTENVQTLGDSNFGMGVRIRGVSRVTDKFINNQLQERTNDTSKKQVRNDLLERLEKPFSLDGSIENIGSSMTEFFTSIEDLSANPADNSLRAQLITKGQTLTRTINQTYSTLADLQREADNRIEQKVSSVNRLSGEIAQVNAQIVASETSEQENLSLRDSREKLLKDLSGLVKIQTADSSDGSVLVSLENGFTLVTGATSRDLAYTKSPTFAPSSGFPPALDGGNLGFIVYNFGTSTSPSDVDMTAVIGGGGGELGGLLQFRGIQTTSDTTIFQAQGDVVNVASRVEAITRDLLTRFNTTYLGPDETAGGTWNPSSGSLTGATPAVFGMFSFSGAADTNADGLPTAADLTTSVSYSRQLTWNISDPTAIAAARDLNATAGVLQFAQGDNSNLLAMAALRTQSTNYSVGNFSAASSIEDLYTDTVAYVGTLRSTAKAEYSYASARQTQVEELRDEVSGVNLDEEFAKLINFQRAYQSSARLIKTGDDLFSELLNVIR
jgi:flagellar hook-associated protein 1 FlgK